MRKPATSLCALLLLTTLILKGPELHKSTLRAYVGSRVYTVRGSYDGRGGGTGFAIKAPSGTTYTLTNDHVCAVSKDGQNVFVHDDSGEGITRKIIARSVYTDLCLVEGMPGVEGLSVAGSEPEIGDVLRVVGHPKLMPLTLSTGDFIGRQTVLVALGIVSETLPCDQPKNEKISLLQVIFGVNPGPDYDGPMLCLEKIKAAYLTNVVIQGGNSGSPVVDFFGNVVGVAFAGDQLGWGIMVSHYDLTKFLALY